MTAPPPSAAQRTGQPGALHTPEFQLGALQTQPCSAGQAPRRMAADGQAVSSSPWDLPMCGNVASTAKVEPVHPPNTCNGFAEYDGLLRLK